MANFSFSSKGGGGEGGLRKIGYIPLTKIHKETKQRPLCADFLKLDNREVREILRDKQATKCDILTYEVVSFLLSVAKTYTDMVLLYSGAPYKS